LWGNNKADSVITEVLRLRDQYGEYVREYEAQVYVKGHTQVIRKNRLSRYAPDFLYWNGESDQSFAEAIVDVRYVLPNHFAQQIRTFRGNRPMINDMRDRLLPFLNINIYHSSIFNDMALLPGSHDVFKYYRFEYVALIDSLDQKIHQIRLHPKVRSQKLIAGDFYIVDGSWTVSRMDVRGKWELFDFRIEAKFGLNREDFLLPVSSLVTFHIKALGNERVSRYFSQFEYQTVKTHDGDTLPSDRPYDLSNYFDLQPDSVPFVGDSAFWAQRRPVPLSRYEQTLDKKPDKAPISADSSFFGQRLWNLSPGLFAPKSFDYKDTKFGYSGLANPLKLAYTKLDGIVYWQQFQIYKQFSGGREFRFRPNIGVLLQRSQVYFGTPATWLFAPEKFGEVSFNFRNRNKTYNSATIRRINLATPDSIHFDDFNLEYYKHYLTDLGVKYEPANGLLVYGKVHYDWYIPVRNPTPPPSTASPEENIHDNDIMDLVRYRYRIFTPALGLRWTPCQFYRIRGKKKEYLHSRFPTFSAEYSRGIRGVLGSNSNYERIEADLQQSIPLSLMRSLHYYLGAGRFTNTQSVYFADFSNFRRQNIPQSWNDPIGGAFHILDNDWYNTSETYIQLHLMYESPFSILQLFHRLTTDIVNERIYLSQLYTPVLPCYTEVGYGVGNFLGHIGVFASLLRGKYEAVGLKFSFELDM
jgi:hypothetical protein